MSGLYMGGQVPDRMWWGGEVAAVYQGADLVWDAAIYPLSGQWENDMAPGVLITVFSHTMVEGGQFTITATPGYANSQYELLRNGSRLSLAPGGDALTWTGNLSAGNVLELKFGGFISGVLSGTWSITPA